MGLLTADILTRVNRRSAGVTGDINDSSVDESQLGLASTMQVPVWDAGFINSKCSFPAMTYKSKMPSVRKFKLTSAEVLTPAESGDHSVIQRVKITNRSET